MTDFEIIVVGGGHAGIEAACAAARMGARVALITGDLARIGEMSCNPAIGGVGKGQLVREIDALGGVMGLLTDRAGIHFRTLNRSKGPAVWSSRAQTDRKLYREAAQQVVKSTSNLDLLEGMVTSIDSKGGHFARVVLADGRKISGKACILCSGTFLNALIHIGEEQTPAGRINESPSLQLSESLQSFGFQAGRLKTGTPPRLDGDTIDYESLEQQAGDDYFRPFSLRTLESVQNKALCHITYTNETTHKYIEANFDKSAMFSGAITGTGPRYCPSIEDKVFRFRDKDRHQLFIEPEGLDTSEIYINGLSTSLPADVQEQLLHTIPGLENVVMTRPGYAVEYDFFPAFQITPSLETRPVEKLYLCGQINGTSGYEEAAAQGLIAGINAALKLQGRNPFYLDRSEAYIGVMIDDLINSVPQEPYRMFTSRAEYRLALREDNVAERLINYGRSLDLISEDVHTRYLEQRKAVDDEKKRLCSVSIELSQLDPALGNGDKQPLARILKRPTVGYRDFAKLDEVAGNISREIADKVEIEIKYAGYLEKQQREIEKFKKLEGKLIPASFDVTQVKGLRTEARLVLEQVQPVNLGQASRLAGVTFSDISVLLVYLKRHGNGGARNVSRETTEPAS